jgi:hypothetical protein
MYKLINTVTKKVVKSNIDLSENEVNALNYAYALNTNSKLKYVKMKEKQPVEETELNLFRYHSPV